MTWSLNRPRSQSRSPSRSRPSLRAGRRSLPLAAAGLLCLALPAAALLSPWLQGAVAGSPVEAALFRTTQLPGATVLFPRPPAEAVTELNRLAGASPNDPALRLLRSRQEESALDLVAAERDLKAYAAASADDPVAQLALADFYHRRLAANDEFAALLAAGSCPVPDLEALRNPLSQAPWQAFERALRLAMDHDLPASAVDRLWNAWSSRYPGQSTLYARAFTWNLNAHRPAAAQAISERYKQVFPADPVFPVKAAALLALSAGGPGAQTRALAVYDGAFRPLWPQSLLDSYFDLLAATHNTRRFVAEAQTRLTDNPEDLDAAARLALLRRHDGHPDTAAALLDDFRRNKEREDPTGRNWPPEELYTLAQLSTAAGLYPEAARYDFALGSLPGQLADGRSARRAGLTGMISLLLQIPDQPLPLGAGNLSMYRDIATLDRGPGFLNGVLSLWLNSGNIAGNFADEEAKAQPYFHRAAAATLIQLLDKTEPAAPERPSLHAQLIQVYAGYGEDSAVLRTGDAFLRAFPDAPERTDVALGMADAYARAKDTQAELAVYDRLLGELARAADRRPLTAAAAFVPPPPTPGDDESDGSITVTADDAASTGDALPARTADAPGGATAAFNLNTGYPSLPPNPAAVAYAAVLDRYLARLTATGRLPEALGVLRKELDRNPDDPKLYERLADFLAQNNLTGQQEEVYRAAIAKFSKPGDTSPYDRLARFYLRQKRQDAFAALTREVTGIFSGTDLDAYFAHVQAGGPGLALQLNLYAHKRFPHDLTFTRNLLAAYRTKPTADPGAWERLLRSAWWQSPELTTEFFAWLSQTGGLDRELAALEPLDIPGANPDPAALTELGQAGLWRSHFEQSSPFFDRLAELYPTDKTVGATAADLHRSLAWLDPAGPGPHTRRAVAIEEHLLAADASDSARLARIGDILADHADLADLADGAHSGYPAAAVWRRIPSTAPGVPGAYLDAATVFWDYFQFDDALAEIHLARTHFNDPVLFGYQAGAILEGKRDLPAAVREYVASASAPPEQTSGAVPAAFDRRGVLGLPSTPDITSQLAADPSADRLLGLARRPASAALADSASAAAVAAGPTLRTLRLRLAVLEILHRAGEGGPLLGTAIAAANTPDAAAELAAFAQSQGNTPAYEAALQREILLTPDPVEKLRLTYDRVRSFIARDDLTDASRLVDATYAANPRVLGVVRFTVDFDWTNKRRESAIAVLQTASAAAAPTLRTRLAAEAAAKANESGNTALGRSLALALLSDDPYNPQFLALAAESYTRAGDPAGLERFFRARLEAIGSAAVTADERRARTAQLRRGLLAAAIAGKDDTAALEQYLALLSAFPEDAALVREAAFFALREGQREGLLGFLRGAIRSSPRDARFFVDLAQTDEVLGDPVGALDAYAGAVALRPERSDLRIAKAALEERLGRLDAAVADYTRLFQLSYNDPQWMLAVARAQARQGHGEAVVQALQTAFLHGAQTTPHDLLTVAAQLEGWGMIPEAARFARQAGSSAGADLLAGQPPSVAPDDPATYARILTRAHAPGDALRALRAALEAAAVSASSPSTLAAQVKTSGLAAVTDAGWRRGFARARREHAEAQFTQAVLAMSATVAVYGSPENRAAYVGLLSAWRATAPRAEVVTRWLPAAHAADLGELEAQWRSELLLSSTAESEDELTPFVGWEGQRLRFAERAATLERFVHGHPASPRRAEAVLEAARSFAAEGMFSAELQLLRSQRLADPDNAPLRDTYLDLLLHRDTNALVALSGDRDGPLADAAVAAALAAAPGPVALAAVRARGAAQPPVWNALGTGLAGLYLGDTSATIDTAFRAALAPDATIGERLRTHPDPARALTGDPWFYAAGRFAQWRLLSPATAAAADDLLPADLERAPGVENLLTLAETEAEAGRVDPALAETAFALELSPGSVDALDARAELLWAAHRRPEAVACWRAALVSLRSAEEKGPAPEAFWTGFARVAARMRQHTLFTDLRPAAGELLRSYLARNGAYRSDELLRAAFDAAPDPDSGVHWLLALAASGKDPTQTLQVLGEAAWLPLPAREAVLARELDLLGAHAPGANADGYWDFRAAQVRSTLLELYVADRKDPQALALIHAAPESARSAPAFEEAALIAEGRAGDLPRLLKSYDGQPSAAPPPDTVRLAAAVLAGDLHWEAARASLQWNFTRAEGAGTLASSDFLTLAEARLATNDIPGALALLRALVSSGPNRSPDARSPDGRYLDAESAATLLEAAHLQSQAIPFLRMLAEGVPWEPGYAVRLAEAQLAAASDVPAAVEGLKAVAHNAAAPYALRARAARNLAAAHARPGSLGDLGSAELTLLAAGSGLPGAARQPFFVEARLAAAAQSPDPHGALALLREAIAIAPSPAAVDAEGDARRTRAFELSARLGQDALARAVLDVLLSRANVYAWPPPSPAAAGSGPLASLRAADRLVSASAPPRPPLPVGEGLLSPARGGALAEEVAQVYIATGEPARARPYLRYAEELLPTDAGGQTERARLRAAIAVLDAGLRLAAADAARRPTVGGQLDQPRIVRVRLTSANAASLFTAPGPAEVP